LFKTDEGSFVFSEPSFKTDEGSFIPSESAEKIYGISFVFFEPLFVFFKPPSTLENISFQDNHCQKDGQK
jgi:hypothetical protein